MNALKIRLFKSRNTDIPRSEKKSGKVTEFLNYGYNIKTFFIKP
jgi:hypothetical protein